MEANLNYETSEILQSFESPSVTQGGTARFWFGLNPEPAAWCVRSLCGDGGWSKTRACRLLEVPARVPAFYERSPARPIDGFARNACTARTAIAWFAGVSLPNWGSRFAWNWPR
jgi:hypothetical protein